VRQYLDDFKKEEGNYIYWIEARVENFKKLEAHLRESLSLLYVIPILYSYLL
jgi:hypothetical protein